MIQYTPTLADRVRPRGALLVVAVTEGVSLSLARPPAEADIVALEAQRFGLAPSYGPFAGVIATHEKFVRQMPGRLAAKPVTGEAAGD